MSIREICVHEKCSGCGACYSICPKTCITFQMDNEGFLRPHIDEHECVNCGQCKNVCPVNHPYDYADTPRSYSILRTLDPKNMRRCSSGGAFVEVAREFLGGCERVAAFGVILDEHMVARFSCVESVEELGTFSGSKYAQAHVGDAYRQVKDRLGRGYRVVFAGTPCQVDALRHFLGKDHESLLLIELICHGVGSPGVFKRYVEYLEGLYGSRLVDFSFTEKVDDWMHKRVVAHFLNGKSYSRMAIAYDDPYMTMYLKHMIMRPSCYTCPYTRLSRTGDITIGDAWGISREQSFKYYGAGASLVIAMTSKGEQIVNRCVKSSTVDIVEPNVYLRYNPQLTTNINVFEDRDSLLKRAMLPDASFGDVARKLPYRNLARRLLSEAKAKILAVLIRTQGLKKERCYTSTRE